MTVKHSRWSNGVLPLDTVSHAGLIPLDTDFSKILYRNCAVFFVGMAKNKWNELILQLYGVA
jgi:hypothetical protein